MRSSIIIVVFASDGGGCCDGGRSLCVRARIDLTRRVDDDDGGGGGYNGTVVARAEREWSAAGCGGRHRRRYDGHTAVDTTGATIIAERCNHTTHTSITADEHPLTFGRRQ